MFLPVILFDGNAYFDEYNARWWCQQGILLSPLGANDNLFCVSQEARQIIVLIYRYIIRTMICAHLPRNSWMEPLIGPWVAVESHLASAKGVGGRTRPETDGAKTMNE
jgi:hypothetical protein